MAPFFKHATIRVFLAVILFDGVHSAPRPNLDRRTSLSSVSTSTSTTRSTTSSTTSSTASSMATVTAPSPSTPSKFPPCAILSKPVLDSTVDCHTFLSDQSISIHRHRFIRLNPNLTSACNLTTNERYCLKPQPDVLPTLQGIPDNPIAVPSDTIKDCTFFDQASDRSQILLRHNLTDFGFLLMNPSALDEFNPNTQYCAIPMGNSTVVDQSFTDETNDNEPTVHGISLVPRPSTSASASSAASSDTDGNGASSTSSLSTSASASVSVSSITESNGVSISAISLPPPTGSTTHSSVKHNSEWVQRGVFQCRRQYRHRFSARLALRQRYFGCSSLQHSSERSSCDE
ncbi:hypothetical protein C8R47DRAFT_446475 [Mycena vitilis]|nr:hypothetical protein C8R47DRAFT_446475 [Mycena vitilis]